MKTLIKSAIIGLLSIMGSNAATQSFTDNQSIGATGATFSFTQFDSSLGTLTAIDLIINSSVPGGSFTVNRANTGGSSVGTLSNFSQRLSVSDDDADLFNGSVVGLSFTGNTTIARNMGTRTFNINSGQSLISSSPTETSVSSSSWLSLYTGSGSVNLAASITPEATFTSGLGITALYTGITTPTSLTLRYTYTTSPGPSPVPETGQVAASLLLLGGIGGYIFIKRRRKQAVAAA